MKKTAAPAFGLTGFAAPLQPVVNGFKKPFSIPERGFVFYKKKVFILLFFSGIRLEANKSCCFYLLFFL
ncbi:MAG: hypothetical protein R6X10_04410 [Desulfobacterales bacterium]